MYNSSTWGLTQKDTKGLDAFHRQQLRQLIGKRYPNKISNQNLYKRCEERPISIDILKGRWRLLGHILRLPDETPAIQAMKFYFERSEKGFRGRPHESIVTTLNKDITRSRSMNGNFEIQSLKTKEDFEHIRSKAQDRNDWRRISEITLGQACLECQRLGREKVADCKIHSDADEESNNEVEIGEKTESVTPLMRKRKIENQIPKLIDDKRRHMQKTLSAAQPDQILMNEAKEDTQLRKDLSTSLRQSTEAFAKALEGMMQIGAGLAKSLETVAHAMVAPPVNQNLFYQSPNTQPRLPFQVSYDGYDVEEKVLPSAQPNVRAQNENAQQTLVDTFEVAIDILKMHKLENTLRFSVFSVDRNFIQANTAKRRSSATKSLREKIASREQLTVVRNNRRYHPQPNVIRNHIAKSRRKQRRSKIDQECLIEKIKQWKTKWQQRLLTRYGNELVLLDATYHTSRYALPLFFLVVKTNVDYQIVATFVCEGETKEAIEEALSIIKDWNPDFKPRYFMTDYSNEEIGALKSTFNNCFVFICDFHREQAWERWLSECSNGCSTVKHEILPRLRRIARSLTETDSEAAITALRSSHFWSDPCDSRLADYVEKYWLSIKKRWIWAYRQKRLLISCNTNNGVERQNESFKYSYLSKRWNTSLTGMLTILIEEVFTDKYESYCEENVRLSLDYRKYAYSVPGFLKNRPRDMVVYCMEKIGLAKRAKEFPPWSWDALPVQYKTSPFLTLDNDVITVETITEIPVQTEQHISHTDEQTDAVDQYSDVHFSGQLETNLGAKNPPTRSQGPELREFRELLDDVRRLSFLIEDNTDVMDKLIKNFQEVRSCLYKALPTEQSTPLLSHQTRQKKEKWQIPSVKMKELTKRKHKLPFSKRVGEKKEKMMRATKLTIYESPTDANIEEEIISYNKHHEYPSEFSATAMEPLESTKSLVNNETSTTTSNVDEPEKLTDKTVWPLLSHSVRENVTLGDQSKISSCKMLNDSVTHTLQQMMLRQYDCASGLQDPLPGQKLKFKPMTNKSFVQTLHDGKFHWVAVSTFGCSAGEVLYMDSLFRGKISTNTRQQICALLNCNLPKIRIMVLPVKQQTNNTDCGIYALAFTQYILLNKNNPSEINFRQEKMRNHMLHALLKDHIDPFPSSSGTAKTNNAAIIKVDLFCICRMPWFASKSRYHGRRMVACDRCGEWYHQLCERIQDEIQDEKTKRSPGAVQCVLAEIRQLVNAL
eukprot:gene18489-20338_t